MNAPEKISVNLTKQCNLRCKHCLTNADFIDENELSSQEWFGLIDQIVSAGTKAINFGGGEPLMRQDLFEILGYSISKGLTTSIVTNGIMLTNDVCKKLNSLGLDVINISLDGLEENHDYLRGQGSFNATIKGIKILRKYNTKIALRFTVNKKNLDQCEAMVNLAEDLKVDVIRMTPMLLLGRAKNTKELIVGQEEYINFLTRANKIKSFVKIVLPHQEDKKNIKDTSFGCHCGKEAVWITQSGDFSPCIFFGDMFKAGNLRENTYVELWEKTKEIMKVVCGNPTCISCPDIKKCRGGCRARALTELDNINAVDPLCPLRRNQ